MLRRKHTAKRPKQHDDAEFLAQKRERFWEPHVAPINEFVDRIAAEQSAHVPYVDPDSGGTQARVILLLESPGGQSALGSGMLSADNDDETAKNVWTAYRDSGMPRSYGLHWNAVPWYVGNQQRNATPSRRDVVEGRRYILELLNLAPDVRVIVALGKKAQMSVADMRDALIDRGLTLIECPHPGPIPAAVTHGESLRQVLDAFTAARKVVAPE